jgi:hypothetical protein
MKAGRAVLCWAPTYTYKWSDRASHVREVGKSVGHDVGNLHSLGTVVGRVVDPLEGRLDGVAVEILMTGSLRGLVGGSLRGLAGVDLVNLLAEEVAS